MPSRTHTSGSQHSANPDTPPPEYSVHVPDHWQGPPSSQHSPVNVIAGDHFPDRQQSLFSSSSTPQFAPPLPFGPTPLMQSRPTLGLLPYYDPHSLHSIEAAISRARWRFIGATFWAISSIACFLLLGMSKGLRKLWSISWALFMHVARMGL